MAIATVHRFRFFVEEQEIATIQTLPKPPTDYEEIDFHGAGNRQIKIAGRKLIENITLELFFDIDDSGYAYMQSWHNSVKAGLEEDYIRECRIEITDGTESTIGGWTFDAWAKRFETTAFDRNTSDKVNAIVELSTSGDVTITGASAVFGDNVE